MVFRLSVFLLLFVFSKTYAQIPAGGLIAHYTFNTSADDASGYNNHGQINGAVAPAEDRFGNSCGAFRFIGTGSYISVPNSNSLKSPLSAFTMAVWVKPEKGPNSNGDLNILVLAKPGIETNAQVKPQYCFQLKRNFGDSYSTISLSSDFSFQDKLYNSHPIEFNRWYFIAVTIDDNLVQVYLDGKPIAQAVKSKPFIANDFALEIGRDIVAGKRYFNGCLDDLRIYNRGLSPVEITAIYKDETEKRNQSGVSLSMPKNIEKNTESGKCYATVFYTEPTVVSDCNSEVMTQLQGLHSGSQYGVGKNTIVYQANQSGKKLTDSFSITVIDREPPVFVCPQNILAAKGMEVLYPDMAVTDNCPNVQLQLLSGLTSGSVFPVGVTVCKYEATDASGNKSQCSFKVTVFDDSKEKALPLKTAKEPDVKPAAEKAKTETPKSETAQNGLNAEDLENIKAAKEEWLKEKTARELAEKNSAEAARIKSEKEAAEKLAAQKDAENKRKALEEDLAKAKAAKEEWLKAKAEKEAAAKMAAEREAAEHERLLKEAEAKERARNENELKQKTNLEALEQNKALEAKVQELEKKVRDLETKAKETDANPKKAEAVIEPARKPDVSALPLPTKTQPVKEERKPQNSVKGFKDEEPPHFDCPLDTTILLPPLRRGLIYHYKQPRVTDNVKLDSVVMAAGPKDGCFLQLGVHPFVYNAYDHAGNVQTCTYSVIIKEDATAQPYQPPVKLEADLQLGTDSVRYEHEATVKNCEITVLIYDDGEQDNDSVSIIFNGEVIVNRNMIRTKENGVILCKLALIPDAENYLIAKAWNTGRYGLNTLRIDVMEGFTGPGEKEFRTAKPSASKVLHSKPGVAGGMLLKCN